MVIKGMNRLKRKAEETPPEEEPKLPHNEVLLEEIRDIQKQRA
jgi:large-conductance mechanosensitive channel